MVSRAENVFNEAGELVDEDARERPRGFLPTLESRCSIAALLETP